MNIYYDLHIAQLSNTTASKHMAQEGKKLEELPNTFKVEDTKSLPSKQELLISTCDYG